MHHPTDRIPHTTAFVTPVVEHWLEREIAQGAGRDEELFYFKSYYHGFTALLVSKYCSVVRAFVHGAMCHRIDTSWGGPRRLT